MADSLFCLIAFSLGFILVLLEQIVNVLYLSKADFGKKHMKEKWEQYVTNFLMVNRKERLKRTVVKSEQQPLVAKR